jgi:hypothetical protein
MPPSCCWDDMNAASMSYPGRDRDRDQQRDHVLIPGSRNCP